MKENQYTGGMPNGYWLDENADGDLAVVASMYILGIADGMMARRSKLDDPLRYENPDLNRENIVDSVRSYYRQNPENKFRQIAAVIRSGC